MIEINQIRKWRVFHLMHHTPQSPYFIVTYETDRDKRSEKQYMTRCVETGFQNRYTEGFILRQSEECDDRQYRDQSD
jgi:hypothetical protein